MNSRNGVSLTPPNKEEDLAKLSCEKFPDIPIHEQASTEICLKPRHEAINEDVQGIDRASHILRSLKLQADEIPSLLLEAALNIISRENTPSSYIPQVWTILKAILLRAKLHQMPTAIETLFKFVSVLDPGCITTYLFPFFINHIDPHCEAVGRDSRTIATSYNKQAGMVDNADEQ
eukprot:TRINITY_DN12185_c0_g1_i3.p2 TRINITY_DN12185_c0_g1~~TRINITY_DN12185_c0_g1_i3.p2  ORF type:complete len:176 (+),score=18.02 TRINITY_DN12185_c0_g1_i3:80-607(+)